jgi:NADH-quinone oxidoreductase subunit C
LSSAETAEAPAPDAGEPAAEAPRDELREGLLEVLRAELGDALVESHIRPGDDLWVRVANEAWTAAADAAAGKLTCTYFDFLSAIDWLPSPFGRDMDSEVDTIVHGGKQKELPPMQSGYAGGDTRLQVFCRLYSITRHVGLTLKADVADDDPRIATLVPRFSGANWHERETWEMYGIDFVGHPQLVHLYLPGGFEGHPGRKDFPLLSRRVKPWPGIVDVEPMPGEEPAEGEATAEEGA